MLIFDIVLDSYGERLGARKVSEYVSAKGWNSFFQIWKKIAKVSKKLEITQKWEGWFIRDAGKVLIFDLFPASYGELLGARKGSGFVSTKGWIFQYRTY